MAIRGSGSSLARLRVNAVSMPGGVRVLKVAVHHRYPLTLQAARQGLGALG